MWTGDLLCELIDLHLIILPSLSFLPMIPPYFLFSQPPSLPLPLRSTPPSFPPSASLRSPPLPSLPFYTSFLRVPFSPSSTKTLPTSTFKRNVKSVFYIAKYGPLKAIYTSPLGRVVHCGTNFSGKHYTRRLFAHIYTTVYSQVLIYTAEWTGASMERTKTAKLRNGNKWDSNPGCLDCESGILPLSYDAPLILNSRDSPLPLSSYQHPRRPHLEKMNWWHRRDGNPDVGRSCWQAAWLWGGQGSRGSLCDGCQRIRSQGW